MPNSLIVAGLLVTALLLGYLLYGRIIVRLWGVDPTRKTPAITHPDGVDYVPAKHWTVLFGHHFSSIAGAGPIIGPVIACFYWGWLPALIWVVIGSIFLGAVHDFSALMASLRHDGQSIAQVAEAVLGKRAKILFASFIWLALVLVIAVFAASAANALTSKPQVVIPTFGLIAVAVFTGLMMYTWNLNQILLTVIGTGLLLALIIVGFYVPLDITRLGGIFARHPVKCWTVILLIYGYIASVTPVNILLQPRDYLATFVLYFGMLLGFVGLIVTHPPMRAPHYGNILTSEGPLWPMLFVTVACGAISGFHSLIASGTTAKQITTEAHAKRVGFGAMIFEGVLAGLAVICVCAGLHWTGHSEWNFPQMMQPGGPGWLVAFGKGYGQISGSIIAWVSGKGQTFGLTLGTLIGIITIKTFIMTTLDSATRIGRYVGEELFTEIIPGKFFRSRFVSTTVIIIFAALLALGPWGKIWPVFGAANQLVAALALIVVTVLLVKLGKPCRYTLYPAIFMLVTTIGALLYLVGWNFIPKTNLLHNVELFGWKSIFGWKSSFAFKHLIENFWDNNLLLVVIGVVLIILAGFMTAEGIRVALNLKKKSTDTTTPTEATQ